ncbi:hypothetical protein RFA54_004446 [Vibrio vulnificus]|nr:hypothetical protein [Vibrio vulnificus]
MMKRNVLLICLGWIYFLLPILIFGFPVFIVFIFGYILGNNSTAKLSDVSSVLGNLASVGAFVLACWIYFSWRLKFFSVKLIERILNAKHEIIKINLNASSSLAAIGVEIKNKIESKEEPCPEDFVSFCLELNEKLKNVNPNKCDDLLSLSMLECDLALFLSDKTKLIETILKYREYYYVSCFSNFRIKIDKQGCYQKELAGKFFTFYSCKFNVKFYLPEIVKSLSIENELRNIGVKFENDEFSGDFSLEELEHFYKDFSIKFNEARDNLVEEIDKYISNQMKPKLLW